MRKAGMEYSPVSVRALWMNVTKRCNQSCAHCHIEASPYRTEQMSRTTIERCLEVASGLDGCENLDITGGAPELHPDFDYLVSEARRMGKQVTVRHNLTVTLDGDPCSGASKEYLPDFFAENRVTVLASLPHYDEQETDRIRGPGVFRKSIDVLRKLNMLGYGQSGSGLVLNLIHNCDGPISSTDRTRVEDEFKKALSSRYDLAFNSLLTVTNMPIGRFKSRLKQDGTLEEYISRLVNSFRKEAIAELTCRYLLSVGCNGHLYDCDFNQVLNMEVSSLSKTIDDFDLAALLGRKIRFGPHCFGCTAGGGSS